MSQRRSCLSFRVLVDEEAELVADDTPIDDEALRMAGLSLDV